VLHDLQARIHVAVDAGGEQGAQRLVAVKLRDLPEYRLVNILRHGGGLPTNLRGDVGQ
jgi:hypothetical protein